MATVEEVLAAMERVVRAATPGPWFATDAPWLGLRFGVASCGDHTQPVIAECREVVEDADKRNATYIADFDPPTLTALLAVARAADAELRHSSPAHRKTLRDALDALTRPPQEDRNA